MTDYAKENLNDGKDIYIICNSGKRGAEKATGVLRDAGIESTSIYTVEGGAKALADVSGALTTDRTEENIDWQYVSGKDAVAAVDDKDAVSYTHLSGIYCHGTLSGVQQDSRMWKSVRCI